MNPMTLADPAATGLGSGLGGLKDLVAGLASRLDFARLLDQRGRLLTIETALPALSLVPERMVMREAVGQPFELVVDALSTSAHFELKLLIGEQMSLRLLQPDGRYKPWHGYVFEAAQLGADGGLARYRLVMRPWISFLGLRRDSFVYQDKTALEIIEDLFKDHAQANYRIEVSESLRRRSLCIQYRESDLDFVQRLLAEEGLGYRFEHLDGQAAKDAEAKLHAKHVLVVTDRAAARPDLGDVRFASIHATANVAGQKDAVNAFTAQRRLAGNAVTLGSWNYKQLAGTTAQSRSNLDLGDVPALEVYDGAGAYRFENAAHAERAAGLALAALELDFKRFEGQGSARHLEAGRNFALVDHPLYGANTSAFNYAGALTASRQRGDNQFVLLAVEHHATNNLGAQAAELLGAGGLERGTYKNHFHAAPAAAAVVPRLQRKPNAPGAQTALVVGIDGEALSTERDVRVKIQFPWQRGSRPLAGGLGHDGSPDIQGNAPANETSGTWVRVAHPSAGANWGSSFTPRIGSEVLVEFIEGDIDRPVIAGALYNGADLPPYVAGVDSGVNHPGVISGLHTHSLDQSGYNQWVVDDATGQLRMRLASSYSVSELGLGHLIQQSAGSAQRGGWRGAGFEANTQGWASVRAAKGLFISTSARQGTYGSAESTQMDAAEAVAQLKAARDLGQRLGDVAKAATAHALTSHDANQGVEKFINTLDPQKDGKHPGPVNGQEAKKAQERSLTDPVETFATPVIVLDTPSTSAWATEASIASFAGQDLSVVAQGDLHQSAAHTYAAVSGQTTSVYTHQGGFKAYAANGPVSLRAHTDELQILADQDVTVISVNDEIHIDANSKIEIIAGQSSVVLEGGDITFTCPGNFEAKGSAHAFLGGGGQAAALPALPVGKVNEPPLEIELHYHYDDLSPVVGAPYKVTFENGTVLQGTLDANGYKLLTGVPKGGYTVEYGEDARPWKPPEPERDDAEFAQAHVQQQGKAAIERMLADDPVPEGARA